MRHVTPFNAFKVLMVWNFTRHLNGKSTLCSDSRNEVPTTVFVGALLWFAPHWLLPKIRVSRNSV